MGGVAQAATLTVGTTADSSGAMDCAVATNVDCSLRDAIDAANSDPGSTITFRSGLTGTITLGDSLPALLQAATISGPGAGQLTVDANDVDNVLSIVPGADAPVAVSGLTLTDGNQPGTKYGGGIYSLNTTLTLKDMVVTGNETADGSGGGVGVVGGSLTMENSTISGNTAGGGLGGGVSTASGSGAATTIRNSTISGNTAQASYGGGGAYFDFSAPATVENSTIYGNTAGAYAGGGLYHFGAYDGDPGLTVTGSTITHNTAARGGGIACYGTTFITHSLTEPILRNTIVFGNHAASADQGADISCDINSNPVDAGVVQASFSLLGSVDPGTGIVQTPPGSDIIGQDPQLGPLAGNGGPTLTQLPANTSPVVNKGSAFGLTADQRGLTRPVAFPGVANSTAAGADGSDIGAVELQLPPPTPAPPAAQKKKKCKKKKHKRSADAAKKKKCKKKKKK
jgi:hypothetical protein